ncbi:helix-turn-helix domain-containing protein [Phenylobacterium sp.]|uniref:ArsR/SmtB family transcription factor n=1 Tax=Phenylobacterium sp. TaxID=1871053 RepID=UPI0025F2ECC5|nr:helix-turn-helix domain-containing protein [Phenylobacterium sp.]
MDAVATSRVLAALGHEGRLLTFMLLGRAGPEGLPAGEIARRAGHLQNTTSTHLSVLSHVGLVVGRREGRSIIYAAAPGRFDEALSFLASGFDHGQSADEPPAFQQRLALGPFRGAREDSRSDAA